MNYKLLIVH